MEPNNEPTTNASKYFQKGFRKGNVGFKVRKPNKETKKSVKNENEDPGPVFQLSQPQLLNSKVTIPAFVPAKSPHNLVEEEFYHNPWGLLVATIFLNKTSCTLAKPFLDQFLKDYPDPRAVLKSKPEDLERYFHTIGLRKRSVQIWKMSRDFVHKKWRRVRDLHGIGRYGEDAFRMFVLGDFTEVPKDRFLKIYREWYLKVAVGKH
ncbi:methyl-CpG-binding domain protein 4 [Aethina tumida]|uniref:methyl-CpG-binding domain protein 4 n=1 Tax=Aethina tumida TaxID=116153 RepID=UPI002148F40A|nr:methyl-CpG-binding domain protein 4 [Aethina tumida]